MNDDDDGDDDVVVDDDVDRSLRPGMLPTLLMKSQGIFILHMTINSHVQHPAFDRAEKVC